jgi:acetyl esterase/lipase
VADVSIERDIVFGRGGDIDLKLDVYRPPAASAKRTAVIHLFGGGFTGGSKNGHYDGCFGLLAQRGYTCIASQYRIVSEGVWPAQIEDVKAAIRWTRANAASLDVDPAKICIAGYSAGGHLAVFAAATANRPEFEGRGGNAGVGSELAACIAYYPVVVMRRRPDGSDAPLMGPNRSDEEYRQASPIEYIDGGSAPMLFLHGTADTVPPSGSLDTFQKLRNAGVEAELHLFAQLPHIFDRYGEFEGACTELSDLFLDRLVVNPRLYERPAPRAAAAAAR